jgi:hypothetical protein
MKFLDLPIIEANGDLSDVTIEADAIESVRRVLTPGPARQTVTDEFCALVRTRSGAEYTVNLEPVAVRRGWIEAVGSTPNEDILALG